MKKLFSSVLLFSAVLSSLGCNASSPGRGPGGRGGGGSADDPDKTGVLPDGSDATAVLPARIRRLTNAEYNASVQTLIGTDLAPGSDFPPDTRQHGFTVNEAQRVDPVLARKLDAAAVVLADEVVARLAEFAPCDSGDYATCAGDFIETFGKKAYRRPLAEGEATALLGLYEVGATDADYASGIHQVVRGILQSPGFLYVTEIGDGSDSGTIAMTQHEIAASLSYLLTGAPPDDALVSAAESGALNTAEGRAAEARRLIESPAGRDRAVRVVREWLGIDRIVSTAKDANIYEDYEGLRTAMNDETDAFVKEVMATSGGSVEDLLGAPWTIVSADLAAMYGVSGEGRVDVPDRPGLLNRGAFLSVYAHAHETSPVLRGTAVLRRIGCVDMQLPTSLDVEIVPPVPDPSQTTRERFAVHSQDAACYFCHKLIDPIGFAFEQFDGMGEYRPDKKENGKEVDSTAEVAIGKDYDGTYASSSELASALSTSDDTRECFARYVFRANAGERAGADATEEAFIESWTQLDADEQKSLIEILVQFAASDLSVYRSEP